MPGKNSISFYPNPVLDVLKNANFINDIDDPRFKRRSDGWIVDTELDLEWGPSSQNSMVFSEAEKYCTSLGGRLPTVDELFSLVDRTKHDPCTNKQVFKDVKNEYYWTSEKTSWNSDARWVVGFCSGSVFCYSESYGYYVRPVRPCQG